MGTMATSDSPDEERADDGPLRTCVATRRREPPERLIRFVVAPDGRLTPDIASRLPGRGAWVVLDRKAVEDAVKTRAFNRSFRRAVDAGDDLAGQVDRLLAARSLAALSIANKAGLVLTGFTKIDATIAAGGPVALLHGSDAGNDGVDKLDRRFAAMCRDLGRHSRILRLFTIEQMSLALGRSNVVHAALMMGGAAQSFLYEADRLLSYRTGRLDVD